MNGLCVSCHEGGSEEKGDLRDYGGFLSHRTCFEEERAEAMGSPEPNWSELDALYDTEAEAIARDREYEYGGFDG